MRVDQNNVPFHGGSFEPVDEPAMDAPQAETWPVTASVNEQFGRDLDAALYGDDDYWRRQKKYAEENRNGGHP